MTFLDDVLSQLDALRAEGLYKHEEPLTTAQAAHVGVPAGTSSTCARTTTWGSRTHPS